MYIINTIPHGKCFVRYLRTRFCIRNLTRSLRSLVRFLIRQQLVRKYRTPALSMKYSLFIYRTFITIINAQSITAICSKMNALTVAWKPSFPDFLATRFFQIRRSFTSLENVKNLKHVFFPFASHILFEQPKTSTPFVRLALLTFRHLERLFP